MPRLGDLVRAAMDEKNLSFSEAAKRAGVGATHVYNIVTGVDSRTKKPFQPSVEILKRLSKGLGISYIALMDAAGYLPSGTPAAVLEWLIRPGNRELVEELMNDPRDYAIAVRAIRQYQSERDSGPTEK